MTKKIAFLCFLFFVLAVTDDAACPENYFGSDCTCFLPIPDDLLIKVGSCSNHTWTIMENLDLSDSVLRIHSDTIHVLKNFSSSAKSQFYWNLDLENISNAGVLEIDGSSHIEGTIHFGILVSNVGAYNVSIMNFKTRPTVFSMSVLSNISSSTLRCINSNISLVQNSAHTYGVIIITDQCISQDTMIIMLIGGLSLVVVSLIGVITVYCWRRNKFWEIKKLRDYMDEGYAASHTDEELETFLPDLPVTK